MHICSSLSFLHLGRYDDWLSTAKKRGQFATRIKLQLFDRIRGQSTFLNVVNYSLWEERRERWLSKDNMNARHDENVRMCVINMYANTHDFVPIYWGKRHTWLGPKRKGTNETERKLDFFLSSFLSYRAIRHFSRRRRRTSPGETKSLHFERKSNRRFVTTLSRERLFARRKPRCCCRSLARPFILRCWEHSGLKEQRCVCVCLHDRWHCPFLFFFMSTTANCLNSQCTHIMLTKQTQRSVFTLSLSLSRRLDCMNKRQAKKRYHCQLSCIIQRLDRDCGVSIE